MKVFRTDCNTTAILPTFLFTFVLLAFLEIIGILYYVLDCFKTSKIWITAVLLFLTLFISNIPKLRQICTIKILLKTIWVINFIRKIKTQFSKNPYNYFWFLTVFGFITIVLFLTYSFDGFISFSNLKLETGNTLALSILITFIPFIFAGFTYSKNRLSNILPAKVVNVCFGKGFLLTCIIQIAIFSISFLSPFMRMKFHLEQTFQIMLIAISFLSALIFIWGMFKVSELHVSLVYFREKEIKKLRNLFIKDIPDIPIKGALWHRIYSFYIIGIISITLNRIAHPLKPQEECYETAKSTLDTFFNIIKKFIRDGYFDDTSVCLNELTEYARCYYSYRQNYIDTSDDKVNPYITNELKLIIESCTNKEREKFLELFLSPIETIGLSACRYKKIGMSSNSLIYGWCKLIKDGAIATSTLENTAFTESIITVLGNLACKSLTEGNRAITELNTIKELGILFAKSKWSYHDYMVINCFTDLNRTLKAYFETLPTQFNSSDYYFLKSYWFEAYFVILSKKLGNFQYNSFLNPFTPIIPPIISPSSNPDTLPVVYGYCLNLTLDDGIFKQIIKGLPSIKENHLQRRMFETRINLLLVHELYISLMNPIIAQTALVWNYFIQTIVSLVYIDLRAVMKMEYFRNEWSAKLLEKYSKLFNQITVVFRESLKNNHSGLLFSEFSMFIAVPAILLAYKNEECADFIETFIIQFKKFLCDILDISQNYRNIHAQETIMGCVLIFAGWLKILGTFTDLRNDLESILQTRKSIRTSYGFESEYISYGFPKGYMLHDKWYLFPSELWEPTLQQKIDEELMKENDLIEYAKQFVEIEVKNLF